MNVHIASIAKPNSEKPGWMARHANKLVEIANRKSPIGCVFLGDSIFAAWEHLVPELWDRYFADLNALNLGFGGDRTEHLLWRIENGELDGYSASVILVLIGTNNTGHRKDDASVTSGAIQKIVEQIRCRQPQAQIALHAILPRGKRPTHPLRQLNNAINKAIFPLSEHENVHWLDFSNLFIDQDGFVPEGVMDDYLHPNANQYEPWGSRLRVALKQLMLEFK